MNKKRLGLRQLMPLASQSPSQGLIQGRWVCFLWAGRRVGWWLRAAHHTCEHQGFSCNHWGTITGAKQRKAAARWEMPLQAWRGGRHHPLHWTPTWVLHMVLPTSSFSAITEGYHCHQGQGIGEVLARISPHSEGRLQNEMQNSFGPPAPWCPPSSSPSLHLASCRGRAASQEKRAGPWPFCVPTAKTETRQAGRANPLLGCQPERKKNAGEGQKQRQHSST